MKRLSAVLVLAVLAAGIIAGTSTAQEESGDPTEAPTIIRSVDSRSAPDVVLTLMTADDVGELTMTQDGQQLEVGDPIAIASSGREIGTVFVIDTGAEMDASGGLIAVKENLAALAAALPANQVVGLIAAGDTAVAVSRLTSSASRLADRVEGLSPSEEGGAAVYGAITLAADLLKADAEVQPNIIVVTSGTDITDGGARSGALGAVESLGGLTFVSGLTSGGFDAGRWAGFVGQTGGAVREYPEVTGLGESIGTVQSWIQADQYQIPFQSTVDGNYSGIVETTLSVSGESVDFAYTNNRLQQGADRLAPFDPGSEPGFVAGLPLIGGSSGRLIGVILVLVSVTGMVYALAVIFTRDEGALSNVLQPYSEDFNAGDDDDDDDASALAKTALIQRAVSLTEQVAESQGYLSRTESALERADMPLRPAEALFFYAAGIVVLAVLSLIFLSPIVAIILIFVAALIGPAIVNIKGSMRRKKFQALLPDTLQLLSGTLRAGYSLMQGVEAVSQEVSEPMGKELRRVVTESRLGRPLEESLDGVAERMASADFGWAVMAIRIQREVGGNLSELLLTVAETMIERERLRREVASLTAEGRVSAFVLVLLPVGLGLAMWVINPKYIIRLFDNTLGNVLLGLAITGIVVGFLWMRQIIKIEI